MLAACGDGATLPRDVAAADGAASDAGADSGRVESGPSGDVAQPADTGTAADTGAAPDAGGVGCDRRPVVCKIALPTCPNPGEVPSVIGTCYGPCVPINACACGAPEDCPERNQYTCHMSARRCGPFLN